jgi:TetR/AcrR family transcriptional regulator
MLDDTDDSTEAHRVPDVDTERDQLPAWARRSAARAGNARTHDADHDRARRIVAAARRLIRSEGGEFTTHRLVREAGIAVQTLYKHFAGKDEVILAVLEDLVVANGRRLEEAGARIADPVERLRFYIHAIVESAAEGQRNDQARFIATEHWRLVQLYPAEVDRATQATVDLLLRQLRAAEADGLLHPPDAAYGAFLANQLLLAVYHHYTFSGIQEPAAVAADRVWSFLLGAWGGRPTPPPTPLTW